MLKALIIFGWTATVFVNSKAQDTVTYRGLSPVYERPHFHAEGISVISSSHNFASKRNFVSLRVGEANSNPFVRSMYFSSNDGKYANLQTMELSYKFQKKSSPYFFKASVLPSSPVVNSSIYYASPSLSREGRLGFTMGYTFRKK